MVSTTYHIILPHECLQCPLANKYDTALRVHQTPRYSQVVQLAQYPLRFVILHVEEIRLLSTQLGKSQLSPANRAFDQQLHYV